MSFLSSIDFLNLLLSHVNSVKQIYSLTLTCKAWYAICKTYPKGRYTSYFESLAYYYIHVFEDLGNLLHTDIWFGTNIRIQFQYGKYTQPYDTIHVSLMEYRFCLEHCLESSRFIYILIGPAPGTYSLVSSDSQRFIATYDTNSTEEPYKLVHVDYVIYSKDGIYYKIRPQTKAERKLYNKETCRLLNNKRIKHIIGIKDKEEYNSNDLDVTLTKEIIIGLNKCSPVRLEYTNQT